MRLRWITRDGKKILQHEALVAGQFHSGQFVWQDVPDYAEPKEKVTEYEIAYVRKASDFKVLTWTHEPGAIRLVDSRLVEKLFVREFYTHKTVEQQLAILDEYHRYVPKGTK